jgi:hypothetical protein
MVLNATTEKTTKCIRTGRGLKLLFLGNAVGMLAW